MTASKAQSPVPGFGDPCLRLIPCFFALAIDLDIINAFSLASKDEICWSDVGPNCGTDEEGCADEKGCADE